MHQGWRSTEGFPSACESAKERGPRDLPGEIDCLSEEEWHRVGRALHLVVISFAPTGLGWVGVGFSRGVGADFLPFAPFSHGFCHGLRSFARFAGFP
jgi:hypothetical protein